MSINRPLTVCAVLALCTLTSAQDSNSVKASEAPSKHLLAPSAKIVGLELATPNKKNVGEIGDLLIDPKSGEIRYAVLEVGGFLGMGEDKRIVPWSLVEISRDKENADKLVARTSLTEKQVESAPKCKDGQMFDAELDRRVETVFGKDDAWAFVGDGSPTFAWLSHMNGAAVLGTDTQEVGKIQELVLAPQNGCVAYIVLDENERAGDKDVAIPWSRAKFTQDKNDKLSVSTDVDNVRLQGAPQFDKKDWKRMSSTTWVTDLSEYYACDPFWKSSRFASARKPKSMAK